MIVKLQQDAGSIAPFIGAGKWSFTPSGLCLAITCLVWGGALWFGSLAWDQKQGAVLALMGFGAWLAVCRFVFPVFWFISIEVIRRFFRYINYRFL
jgi:hypothetical protein